MKKNALLFLMGFFMFQTTVYGQFSIGLSNGLNISSEKRTGLQEPEYGSVKPDFNYFFGITSKYNISPKVAIKGDIQYSPKGYKINYYESEAVLRAKYSYIDILPGIEYSLNQNFAVGVGINFGILLDYSIKAEKEEWSSLKDLEVIKPVDVGMTGCVKGYFGRIFLMASYNFGLSDISKIIFTDANGVPMENQPKLFNRNFQLSVGYLFSMDKN